MATITIRNLDETVKRTLQVRAALNGRSMEAEARALLTDHVTEKTAGQGAGLGTAINDLFAPVWATPEIESFKAACEQYQPTQIKLLFIAKAPPRLDSGRFFYFTDVLEKDTLFLEMMKVLYPSEVGFSEEEKDLFSAKELRAGKSKFLSQFQSDGFFLIDSIENPMPEKANPTLKKRIIRDSLSVLQDRLKGLRLTEGQRLILLGDPVYSVCSAPFRERGYRVLNDGPIRTPAFGGAKLFRQQLRRTLELHNLIGKSSSRG
jgi:plasmid stability protein